ncbi:MAG TPA: deoxyribose-phosphate aldolase [Flavipsychrobacter sp.]|nr:deoxyribose-phosphate aldolase [Flavipsychrobacter sp.]
MAINIASYIDHTTLKPATTIADIKKVCEEAIAENFVAICIPPYFVTEAKALLNGTDIKVATVIGFPFGYSTTLSKFCEIKEAIQNGADELDMVHNLAALKSGKWGYLGNEIKTCTETIHSSGKKIKVIVESGSLTDEELIKCCELYSKYDIDFMKTSTGFSETGATVHAVEIMRSHLPNHIAIKASAGIRNFEFAKKLIDAGATRLGCSASIQIVKESKEAELI